MEPGAFERLVAEHQQMVYCVALSHCRDAAAAEDVAQEAFLKAYRSMDGFRKQSRVKTWLYSVARNTAVDYVRRRRKEQPARIPDRAAPEPAEDRSGRVMEVINGLREDYREIMLLRYVQGLTYTEIARTVGASAASVGEKLFRIRELVREKLRTEVAS